MKFSIPSSFTIYFFVFPFFLRGPEGKTTPLSVGPLIKQKLPLELLRQRLPNYALDQKCMDEQVPVLVAVEEVPASVEDVSVADEEVVVPT